MCFKFIFKYKCLHDYAGIKFPFFQYNDIYIQRRIINNEEIQYDAWFQRFICNYLLGK